MASLPSMSMLMAAYAAGVLMFFAPCSVGLLPAYLSYFYTHGTESDQDRQRPDSERGAVQTALLVNGVFLFVIGAVPLFYMAVSGIRVKLPGYDIIIPLAMLGASYLPPVVVVTIGTLMTLLGLGQEAVSDSLRVGGSVTTGVLAVYLLIGGIVLVLGHWVEPYLVSLELLVGPLLVGLGVMYYYNVSPLQSISLPERGSATVPTFLTFGVVYGVGSLACNLPVFLGVILSSFATDGFVAGLVIFGTFAAGMGTLVLGVSVAARVTGGSVSVGRYGRAARLVGSVAFVAIGLYVTWYTLRSFEYISGGPLV